MKTVILGDFDQHEEIAKFGQMVFPQNGRNPQIWPFSPSFYSVLGQQISLASCWAPSGMNYYHLARKNHDLLSKTPKNYNFSLFWHSYGVRLCPRADTSYPYVSDQHHFHL